MRPRLRLRRVVRCGELRARDRAAGTVARLERHSLMGVGGEISEVASYQEPARHPSRVGAFRRFWLRTQRVWISCAGVSERGFWLVRLALALGSVAADVVSAVALEGCDRQAVVLGAVLAGPGIHFQRAFAVNLITLLELAGGLGGLAEARDAHPLDGIILANPDPHSHPRFAGLRCPPLGIGGEEAVEGAINRAHDVSSFMRVILASTVTRLAETSSRRVTCDIPFRAAHRIEPAAHARSRSAASSPAAGKSSIADTIKPQNASTRLFGFNRLI